jgi:hypothetical protein
MYIRHRPFSICTVPAPFSYMYFSVLAYFLKSYSERSTIGFFLFTVFIYSLGMKMSVQAVHVRITCMRSRDLDVAARFSFDKYTLKRCMIVHVKVLF